MIKFYTHSNEYGPFKNTGVASKISAGKFLLTPFVFICMSRSVVNLPLHKWAISGLLSELTGVINQLNSHLKPTTMAAAKSEVKTYHISPGGVGSSNGLAIHGDHGQGAPLSASQYRLHSFEPINEDEPEKFSLIENRPSSYLIVGGFEVDRFAS